MHGQVEDVQNPTVDIQRVQEIYFSLSNENFPYETLLLSRSISIMFL